MVKALLVVLILAVPAVPRPAEACGGCFAPPGPFTAVQGHRMVIALGVDRTILWDQFVYTGAPEEFAWVLPVPASGAEVAIADQDFVDRIDQGTTPIVVPPADPCSAAGGCDGGFGSSGPPPVDGVTVLQHGTVGPYETVTIGADDPDAMYTWLGVNGYAFPAEGVPVLDHYIDAGSAFLVLRLRPGADVSAMRPVRIRYRGFMASFPLEMVTLGAEGALELSLWVIAEQRYAARNYPTVTIDASHLVWDWATASANYAEAFAATIEDHGGRAWVTEYAGVLAGSPLIASLKKDASADAEAVLGAVPVPYLTRLRTRMLVDHIDQDLALEPAADPGDVSRTVVAGRSIGADCPAGAMSVAGGRSPPAAGILLALAVAFIARPGSRRRRARR
jgi:hypothetical protein